MSDENNGQIPTPPESEPETPETSAPETDGTAEETAPAAPEGDAPAAEAAPASGEKAYADSDAIMVFLSYFGLLSLIPFFMFKSQRDDPKKDYVYWHARQGVTLVVTFIVLFICFTVLTFIPFVGCAVLILNLLMALSMLIVTILCWVKAFGNQRWKIPVIGNLAEKLG